MRRIAEPELMIDPAQARAYAEADFSEAHDRIVAWFGKKLPCFAGTGMVMDLGCGPGDVTFRFARAYPGVRVIGVDASSPMLRLARKGVCESVDLRKRIRFVKAYIPGPAIPRIRYSAIISNSLLHHLKDPMLFWRLVGRLAGHGTMVYVADLLRPRTKQRARAIVEKSAKNEAPVLREDFYHSLLAAYSLMEVREQLRQAGLKGLQVSRIDEIHLAAHGGT
ncbi:MAG: class I SAM-dependent methyltransferase [Verrucomicrobiae bacterium]|nr:class I SAM-dependent methyltransferase [Verrucomicrobiae bacterium]